MNESICKLLPWDSAHFAVRIGRVEVNRLTPTRVRDIDAWLKANPVDCLYFLAAPEGDTLRLAAESGFRFVDARVTLGRALTEIPSEQELDGVVRPAIEEDLDELEQIASESHHDSRFYVDGRFSRSACDALYRIWIRKGFEDKEGAVFVVLQAHQVAGYISVNVNHGEGAISLIAVDVRFRGRGLATRLIRRAEAWFRQQKVPGIIVPTQAANVAALRLYESCGFKIAKVEPWFHRWIPKKVDSCGAQCPA